MRLRNLLIPLVSLILLCAACSKSTENPSDSQILEQQVQAMVDSIWQDYADENGLDLAGVLFHAQHGDERYFCMSNMPSSTSHLSLFRAASVTKTFTASAIMLLQQRGELDIDDLITADIPDQNEPYLPDNDDFAIPFKDQITIRDLLEHRAGVFDPTNFDIPDSIDADYAGTNWLGYMLEQDEAHFFSIDEVISVLATHQLYHHEPGAEYSYSNTGYMLLGKIIERISGTDYEGFIRNEFILPNALGSISFPLDPAHTLPEPYIPCNVYVDSNAESADIYNMSYEVAQGNLVTNSEDLLDWVLKWQKGTAGLPSSVIEQMRYSSYPDQDYGMGTSFYPGFGYGHTGALAGYLTLMFYDPATDFGFVLLCNAWDMTDLESFNNLAYEIFDIAAEAKTLITSEKAIPPSKTDIELIRMAFSKGR